MYLPQAFFVVLLLSRLGLGFPFSHNNAQQPLISSHDNFNLTPVRDALVSNKVIPDVLDDFEPKFYLDVVYPKHDKRVMLGNELEVKDLKKRPRFGIHEIPNRQPSTSIEPLTFTLILTDPDATSRYDPKWSEMCHWIVTNITAENNSDGRGGIELDLEEDYAFPFNLDFELSLSPYKHKNQQCKKDKQGGKCLPGELESYFPPGPPPRTGWHRYVFVLLAGDTSQLTRPKERKHWGYGLKRHGVRDWAIENGLEVVGANFFLAENPKQ